MSKLFVQKISATELARNVASVIDQVRVSRKRLTITKGNQEVAQILPVQDSYFTLGDLHQLLQRSALSDVEKRAFADDLRVVRKSASLPDNSWD